MLSNRQKWIALTGVLLALPCISTAAQPDHSPCATAIDPDQYPAAKELTDKGKLAYESHKYVDAVRYFEDAHCILPTPVFRHNVSAVYRKLGDCANAMGNAELWEREADPSDRPEAREWTASILKECLQVTISSEPPGAVLTIDARKDAVPRVTPWSGWINAGLHKIVAVRSGYLRETKVLPIHAGDSNTIRIAMTKESAASKATAGPNPYPVVESGARRKPAAPVASKHAETQDDGFPIIELGDAPKKPAKHAAGTDAGRPTRHVVESSGD